MRDADIRAAVLIFRTANALTLGGIANCANFPRALDAERSGIGSMPAGNGRGEGGVGRGAWGVGRGIRFSLHAPRPTLHYSGGAGASGWGSVGSGPRRGKSGGWRGEPPRGYCTGSVSLDGR